LQEHINKHLRKEGVKMPIEENEIKLEKDEGFEVALALLQPDKSKSEIAIGYLIRLSDYPSKIAIKKAFPDVWLNALKEGRELHKKRTTLPNCHLIFD
jgi:hypothetical protein